MLRVSKIVKYIAFALMALFGLLGGLFVVGEGFAAAWMSALWVVSLVALSVFALLRPAAAGPWFVGITAVVAAFTLADSAFHMVPRDSWGPVAAIVVFELGVALAFLGLHRAGLAGALMVLAGLAQLAATLLVRGTGEGAPLGAVLGGSSGVVVVPIVLIGALFLLSNSLTHVTMHARKPRQVRPTH